MMKVVSLLGGLGFVSAMVQGPLVFTRSVRDGIYTSGQAGRGKAQYTEFCAGCHMPDLAGRVDPAATSRNPGSSAPALRGGVFVAKWTGMSVGDLFDRIRISMPQERPGALSRRQNADILAFILQENGYASGADELPTTGSVLTPIRFEP